MLPQAEEDIERNAAWWATHHSVEQAICWLSAVKNQLQSLADSPESYPVSAENGDFKYTIRDKRVGTGNRPRYRAVFTVRSDEVFILAIRAAEQDFLRPSDVDLPQ